MSINGELKFIIERYIISAGSNGITVKEIKELLIEEGYLPTPESISDNTIRQTMKDLHGAHFGDSCNQFIGVRGYRGEFRLFYCSVADLLPACKDHVPKPPGEARQ